VAPFIGSVNCGAALNHFLSHLLAIVCHSSPWRSIMDKPIELSLEQQFNLRSFQDQVANMSREQAQQFLIKLYEQMMLRETMYKHFLKHQWGIESGTQF
jgi:hypothetical protein